VTQAAVEEGSKGAKGVRNVDEMITASYRPKVKSQLRMNILMAKYIFYAAYLRVINILFENKTAI